MLKQAGPFVGQRIQRVAVDDVGEPDRIVRASRDHPAVAVSPPPGERDRDAEVADDPPPLPRKSRGTGVSEPWARAGAAAVAASAMSPPTAADPASRRKPNRCTWP